MQIIQSKQEMIRLANHLRNKGKTIGFVPTMGYLHDGHLSLLRTAKQQSGISIVSIFVNPTQFGQNEDFSKYPRNTERDLKLLESSYVDIVFIPTVDEIYPSGFQTYIEVSEISKEFEGEFRPGHFKGVTTIVSILLNIVKPHYTYFGQKDAQQVEVIKRMVVDLAIDTGIVVCPIIREGDGLAMSSRNVYLSNTERSDAVVISRSLNFAKELISQGEYNCSTIKEKMVSLYNSIQSATLNYIVIVSAEDFKCVDSLITGKSYYILIACFIGKTRLIDNELIKL